MRSVTSSDKKLLLWMGGGVALLIAVTTVLSPQKSGNDPRPIVSNNGTKGLKAAFLLLPKLGYKVERWDAPEDQLDRVDASKTTLIMADTYIDPKLQKQTEAAVKRFLERGGRVLDTGGGTLLPGGATGPATVKHPELCYTTPEGQGRLAQAGQVSFADEGAWNEKDSKLGPALRVEQRCGDDAVAVRYAVGKGEAIWWSSSMPLSNRGLHDDGSLKLLLATVGEPGRTVLFDEFFHGERTDAWDAAKGLPLPWLKWQLAAIGFLLILSFSRRKGPLRMPVAVPRTSPVEFAESMGHLYERAGATNAATGMARRRLLRFLQNEAGVTRVVIEGGPAAIAEALRERLGGDWSMLQTHLQDAAAAENTEIAPRSALRLVQALDEDVERLQRILQPKRTAEAKVLKEDKQVEAAELMAAAKE